MTRLCPLVLGRTLRGQITDTKLYAKGKPAIITRSPGWSSSQSLRKSDRKQEWQGLTEQSQVFCPSAQFGPRHPRLTTMARRIWNYDFPAYVTWHIATESGPAVWIFICPSTNHSIQLTSYSSISKIPLQSNLSLQLLRNCVFFFSITADIYCVSFSWTSQLN